MAEKRPICNYSGVLKELQDGDSLPSSLGGVPVILFAYKSADQTVPTQTTYADDSHLFVTLEAASTYIIELMVFGTNTGAASALKYKFSGSITSINLNHRYSGNTTTQHLSNNTETTESTTVNRWGYVGTDMYLRVCGTIVTNDSDIFRIQWTRNAAAENIITIKKGSYLKLTKI